MSLFRRREQPVSADDEAWQAELAEMNVPDPVLLDPWADSYDWLDLADTVRPVARSRHKVAQLAQARMFIEDCEHLPDVTGRAAIILLASRNTDPVEKTAGVKAGDWTGRRVRCRTCPRVWDATIADPYFAATTPRNGLCATCVIVASRPGDAVPVIEGTVVPKQVRGRRKAREIEE